MFKYRLLMQKTGSAAYISHLDLMKAIQRSLTRAKLPAKYSQGFNPHINLSIVVPLSTGYESRYDIVDFELTEPVEFDDILNRLNTAFPPGLHGIAVKAPEKAAGSVAFCSFDIVYENGNAEAMRAAFSSDIELEKQSKRGKKMIKLQDYIKSIEFEQAGSGVICKCVLSAGNDPLNPAYITAGLVQCNAFADYWGVKYIRTCIFDADMTEFF